VTLRAVILPGAKLHDEVKLRRFVHFFLRTNLQATLKFKKLLELQRKAKKL